MRQRRGPVRRGLSLLEVLIALAVFLISYIAIYQLMSLASKEAMDLSYRNEATRLAQSKLAEIAANVVPMESSGDTAFDDPHGDYSWSADVENGVAANLMTISVTVSRTNTNGNDVKVTVTQMMINTQYIGNTQDVQLAPLSSTSTSSSSSSGTSGSTGTSGTTGSTGTTGTTGTTKSSTTTPSTGSK